MGAYKQFLASDIVTAPLTVNKDFTFQGNELTGSDVGIERLLGQNITSPLFSPSSEATTGLLSTQYQRLVYNSIKELYYSNYLSSSYGDPVSRPILIPGSTPEGDTLIGSASNQAYYNYLQTTLSYSKYFPTSSGALLGVISIPVRLFGDYIKPNSFILTSESGSLTDDGEGNILSGGLIVGNIFYSHGNIVLTSASSDIITNFITSSNAICYFSSSYTIYETQYKCTIRENEFNFTFNPSTTSGSTSTSSSIGTFFTPGENVYGYTTESYFSPYITTVGLYDETQNLLAIGKLAQPLPSSPTTDTTILINIDR
jgi:hypothetical protein